MIRPRHISLASAFFVLASLAVQAQPPVNPPGLTWDPGFPKVTPIGLVMAIEAEAHYVAPKGYAIGNVRLRTQVCKAGLPGVADTTVAAQEWKGSLGAGQQPGPLGFSLRGTPMKNGLPNPAFDSSKTYICTFLVDITDDKGKKSADLELAPNAVAGVAPAPPGGGGGCEESENSDPPTNAQLIPNASVRGVRPSRTGNGESETESAPIPPHGR